MSSPTQETGRRLPKYKRAPDRFGGFRLTERDRSILELVYSYRFVEARHVVALLGGSARQIAYRLQGLYHHDYVDRFVPRLKMRMELGSPKMAYALKAKGAEELRRTWSERWNREVRADEVGWRREHNRRQEWFLEHQVAISHFRAVLTLAMRQDAVLMPTWVQGDEIRGSATVRYPTGNDQVFRTAPDAYFTLMDTAERNFFLELDRGTEESRRIRRKFESYWWYLQSSDYAERYPNHRDVRVLVVTTTERRMQNMMSVLAEMGQPNRSPFGGPGMFWFTTESAYSLEEPTSLVRPIWRTITRPDTATLV